MGSRCNDRESAIDAIGTLLLGLEQRGHELHSLNLFDIMQSEQDLDCDLKTMQVALRELGDTAPTLVAEAVKRRNFCLPVYQLPVEVLTQIFHYATTTFNGFYITSLSIPHLRLLASVSTAWRDIVLHSPRLWAVLGGKNSQHSKEILQRSSNAPLTVLGTAVAEALDHPERWLTLIARRYEKPLTPKGNLIARFLSKLAEAPKLRHLVVNGIREPLTTPFPASQKLVYIDIRRVSFDPTTIPYSNLPPLTYLAMEDFDFSNWPIIWSLIANSPNLEHLALSSLQRDISGHVHNLVPPQSVVHLPKLKTACLAGVPLLYLLDALQWTVGDSLQGLVVGNVLDWRSVSTSSAEALSGALHSPGRGTLVHRVTTQFHGDIHLHVTLSPGRFSTETRLGKTPMPGVIADETTRFRFTIVTPPNSGMPLTMPYWLSHGPRLPVHLVVGDVDRPLGGMENQCRDELLIGSGPCPTVLELQFVWDEDSLRWASKVLPVVGMRSQLETLMFRMPDNEEQAEAVSTLLNSILERRLREQRSDIGEIKELKLYRTDLDEPSS